MLDDAALTGLALRAQAADADAGAELVRQTYRQVWRLLVVLADRRVAEDLTQETFARVFRSLPGFRAESPVRAWVLAIARRVAADHIRSIKARPRLAVADPGLEGVAPDDVAESVALRELLDRLDPDRRLAFVLTQMIGLSYAEAAEVCACPVGTIRSRVARARAELAVLLDDAPQTLRSS